MIQMQKQGMLYDIAHSSFVDGPGVRTTVFFKGCNLECRWCHNPESQSSQRQMIFYQNKCTGCGECVRVCPNHMKDCSLCGNCVKYCPVNARKVCGQIWSAEEVMNKIRQDKLFFEMSGGGVTFSGGECMLQIGFLQELLMKCKEEGIHTAVDTAGHVPWTYFEQILPYTDLFLYDVKCVSADLHREGTGVSNERILDNLKRLSAEFAGEIIVRIPVIPGFNMNEEEMRQISAFLKKIRCRKPELLPYHQLGEAKYTALDKVRIAYEVPSKEDMKRMEAFFET